VPARLTEAGRLARKHGLTLAGLKYRLEKGLPLDADIPTGRQRATDTRPSKRELARRYGLPYQTVCSRLRRGIPLDAPVMSASQSTAKARKAKVKQNPDGLDDVIFADFGAACNPFACMVVR
jgi:hypothetical protein